MSDIVGRYIPKHTDRLFELRDSAQAEDLRNREVAPDPEPFDTSVLDRKHYEVSVYDDLAELRTRLSNERAEAARIPHCRAEGCDNLLTIGDRWGICEECRRNGWSGS